MRSTDEEFIAIWNKYHSAIRVAEVLDIDVRNVHARRKKLEEMLNRLIDNKFASNDEILHKFLTIPEFEI
jgi:hypothetical protein